MEFSRQQMDEFRVELKTLGEFLQEISKDLNERPYLMEKASYRRDIDVLLDEVLRIQKTLGKKNFNSIAYVLRAPKKGKVKKKDEA
jgi:hypothetical protein